MAATKLANTGCSSSSFLSRPVMSIVTARWCASTSSSLGDTDVRRRRECTPRDSPVVNNTSSRSCLDSCASSGGWVASDTPGGS